MAQKKKAEAAVSVAVAPMRKKREIPRVSSGAKKEIRNVVAAKPAEEKKSAPVHLSIGNSDQDTSQNIPIKSGAPMMQSPYGERFQLALFKPGKLALRNDSLISKTARVAGLLFVAIGAAFTLTHFQYMSVAPLESVSQSATTICASGTTCTTTTSGGSPNSIDTTPDVIFSVDASESGKLSGVVPVYVSVLNASAVTVFGYYKNEGRLVTLGAATRMGDVDRWVFDWDTRIHADGEYKLKVLIVNNFGTYDEIANVYRIVENDLSETNGGPDSDTEDDSENDSSDDANSTTSATGSDATTTTEDEIDEEETATETHSVTIDDLPAALRETVRVTMTAEDAERVKVYLKRNSDSASFFLGQAFLVDEHDGEWRYSFNTRAYPNGSYSLRAVATFDDVATESQSAVVLIENIAPLNTATTTPKTATTEPVSATATAAMRPAVALSVASDGSLRDSAEIRIEVKEAQFVELYASPKYALTPTFLGLAQKRDANRWHFVWDTRKTPNGAYQLFAKVKNVYGTYESSKTDVAIYNEVQRPNTSDEVVTKETESLKETVDPIQKELEQNTIRYISEYKTENRTEDREEDSGAAENEKDPVDATEDREKSDDTDQPAATEQILSPEEKAKRHVAELLETYQDRVNDEVRRFSSALRKGDEEGITRAKSRLSDLRNEIHASALDSVAENELVQMIDNQLTTLFERIEKDTEKTETIIKERVGEVIAKDSDNDGITDYDEVNLYDTDPSIADSDQDGFADGAEILSGFDPKNSAPEVIVAYESPKEAGVVREDILTVETVASFEQTAEEVTYDGVKSEAVITGKGLPNSFVTLHIFSTPIVVTVKTEADGSWSYIFDKELEDGEHEVFVSMTDNAGKIVAKSAPFSFVKTAEAFSPVDTGGAALMETSEIAAPSFFGQHMVLIVLSLAVVAIGLILMLLGFHMESKKKRPTLEAIPAPSEPQTI